MKDSKNYVIAALCLVLCIMAVGFAAFSSNLTVNSTATIGSTWKVKFAVPGDTNVGTISETGMTSTDGYKKCVVDNAGGSLTPTGSVTVTDTVVTMTADLKQPGDSVTCYAVVANEGTINAKYDGKTDVSDGSDEYVQFTLNEPTTAEALNAGATKVVSINATYKTTATDTPTEGYSASYTAVLNYVQNNS